MDMDTNTKMKEIQTICSEINHPFPADVVPTRELCIKNAFHYNYSWYALTYFNENDRNLFGKANVKAVEIRNNSIDKARKIYYESDYSGWPAYAKAEDQAWKTYYESIAFAWFDIWSKENTSN